MVDLDSIIVSDTSSSPSPLLLQKSREGSSTGIGTTTATATAVATSSAIVGAAYSDSHLSHSHGPTSSLTVALASVEQLLSVVKTRHIPLLGLSARLSPDHPTCRKLLDVGMREVLPLPLPKHSRDVLLKYGRLYRYFNNAAPHDSGEKGGEKPPSPKAATGDKGNNNVGSTHRTAPPPPRAGLSMMHKSSAASPYLNNHSHLGGGGVGTDNSVNTIHPHNNSINNNHLSNNFATTNTSAISLVRPFASSLMRSARSSFQRPPSATTTTAALGPVHTHTGPLPPQLSNYTSGITGNNLSVGAPRSGIPPHLQGTNPMMFTGSRTSPAAFGPNPNVTMGKESHSAVGTIHFMAPEVIFERRYGRLVEYSLQA